jgi:hypothetical protein
MNINQLSDTMSLVKFHIWLFSGRLAIGEEIRNIMSIYDIKMEI